MGKMKSSLKNLLVGLVPKSVRHFLLYDFLTKENSYDHFMISNSQEGEDLIINNLLNWKKNGFYIDVGAHHPYRFSNTSFFYKRGWSGINIDPMPDSMKQFNLLRPNDINLEVGISRKQGELDYYVFSESALNTFSMEIAQEVLRDKRQKLITKKKIKTMPLSDILEKYVPKGVKIDLLDIDVEGMDDEVLMSNNWEKFRPKLVIIEDKSSVKESTESIQGKFMQNLGYSLECKTKKVAFYLDTFE